MSQDFNMYDSEEDDALPNLYSDDEQDEGSEIGVFNVDTRGYHSWLTTFLTENSLSEQAEAMLVAILKDLDYKNSILVKLCHANERLQEKKAEMGISLYTAKLKDKHKSKLIDYLTFAIGGLFVLLIILSRF